MLVTDEGAPLYDSAVICEYLDYLHGGGDSSPRSGPERWRTLRMQALADGILEASILDVLRADDAPEAKQWAAWLEGQTEKGVRGSTL